MLHCTAYKQERSHSTHLQQLYIENGEDILGHFLFEKEDIEEKKELLFAIHMEKKTTSNEGNINKIVRFNVWFIHNICRCDLTIQVHTQKGEGEG